MGATERTNVYGTGDAETTYLDVQATLGISKHMGGYTSTDRLYELCHVSVAREALDVGCGIGVGPVHMAKEFDCRVVAVDLSAKMLRWAGERARREGVEDRITFRQADIRDLPFDDERFDAVIVESVLAFVEDKAAAIEELIRVTRPGGYVGLNESFWTDVPPKHLLEYSAAIGPQIVSEDEWRAIWQETALEDRTIEVLAMDAKDELRDRIEWVGWRRILPAWGRAIKLALADPSFRSAIRTQLNMPRELMGYFGDALFVGRKPSGSLS